MSYYAYDANGYVGDVASIGGWQDFRTWAKQDLRPEVRELLQFGRSLAPAELAKQLDELRATNPDVESVRANLATLAAKASEVLIVTDTPGDIGDESV